MVSVARKNLLKDKVRFVITLTGVIFSVVLMFFQVGVYLGFMQNAAIIIDNTDADLWITAKNSRNFDFSNPIFEYKVDQALSYPDVQWVEKLILTFGLFKLPDGGTEQSELIGFNPDTGIGGPWRLRAGRVQDVKAGRAVIVDASAKKKLGAFHVGDRREIMGKKVRIVGISEGVVSFTTAPYIFMSHENAQALSKVLRRGQTTFGLVKLRPGADKQQAVRALTQSIGNVDVYTKEDYSWKTKMYWTVETGMGIGFLITAFMGFVVGAVIVGQTIYTSTVENIREYGTLKAIGARNWDIIRIIFEQALINALLGFGLGLALTYLVKHGYERTGNPLIVSPQVVLLIFGLTLVMCLGSSFVSVRKVLKVDPALVFRS